MLTRSSGLLRIGSHGWNNWKKKKNLETRIQNKNINGKLDWKFDESGHFFLKFETENEKDK